MNPLPIAIIKSNIPPIIGISAKNAWATDTLVDAIPWTDLLATSLTISTAWSVTLFISGCITFIISTALTAVVFAASLMASLVAGLSDISFNTPANKMSFLFSSGLSSCQDLSTILSFPVESSTKLRIVFIIDSLILTPVWRAILPILVASDINPELDIWLEEFMLGDLFIFEIISLAWPIIFVKLFANSFTSLTSDPPIYPPRLL